MEFWKVKKDDIRTQSLSKSIWQRCSRWTCKLPDSKARWIKENINFTMYMYDICNFKKLESWTVWLTLRGMLHFPASEWLQRWLLLPNLFHCSVMLPFVTTYCPPAFAGPHFNARASPCLISSSVKTSYPTSWLKMWRVCLWLLY